MSSTRNPGRVAGLWYLFRITLGQLYLVYVPERGSLSPEAASNTNYHALYE